MTPANAGPAGAISLPPDKHGRSLRVDFFRCDDRFMHRIIVVGRDGETAMLESVEGDQQTAWPPSPPCQQISFERRGDDRSVALLVGMAGRSHWSMSVAPAMGDDGNQPMIEFDVACRTNQPPSWLGSTYRIFDESATGTADETGVEIGGGLRIKLADGQLNNVELRPADEPNRLAVACRCEPCTMPATFRWRYRIVLLGE